MTQDSRQSGSALADRYTADHSDHGVSIVLDTAVGGWGRIVCGCQSDEIAEAIAHSLNADHTAVSLTEADRRFIERVLLRDTAGPDRRYAQSIVAKLHDVGPA
jgi:hypothetical protein